MVDCDDKVDLKELSHREAEAAKDFARKEHIKAIYYHIFCALRGLDSPATISRNIRNYYLSMPNPPPTAAALADVNELLTDSCIWKLLNDPQPAQCFSELVAIWE